MATRHLLNLKLSLRLLLRDVLAGEITLLAIALIVAVASMTSVGFLTDRVSAALEREANQILGGDAPKRPARKGSPSMKV